MLFYGFQTLKYYLIFIWLALWEEQIFPQSGIFFTLGMDQGGQCHPHEFAQSHIGERRLPPAAYKHELTSEVYPSSRTTSKQV